jgi:hypothetical protein
VNTGEKRGFVPKRGELEERCGKVGGVKKCEKREARSEKQRSCMYSTMQQKLK